MYKEVHGCIQPLCHTRIECRRKWIRTLVLLVQEDAVSSLKWTGFKLVGHWWNPSPAGCPVLGLFSSWTDQIIGNGSHARESIGAQLFKGTCLKWSEWQDSNLHCPRPKRGRKPATGYTPIKTSQIKCLDARFLSSHNDRNSLLQASKAKARLVFSIVSTHAPRRDAT